MCWALTRSIKLSAVEMTRSIAWLVEIIQKIAVRPVAAILYSSVMCISPILFWTDRFRGKSFQFWMYSAKEYVVLVSKVLVQHEFFLAAPWSLIARPGRRIIWSSIQRIYYCLKVRSNFRCPLGILWPLLAHNWFHFPRRNQEMISSIAASDWI